MKQTQDERLREMGREASAAQAIGHQRDRYALVLGRMLSGQAVSRADVATITTALVAACRDLQWPAKRYADGRSTYAVGMVNDATRTLLHLGLSISPTDGSVWAEDGQFGMPSYAHEAPAHD